MYLVTCEARRARAFMLTKTVARYNLGRPNKSLHASRDCVFLKMPYQFIVAATARPRELNRWRASLIENNWPTAWLPRRAVTSSVTTRGFRGWKWRSVSRASSLPRDAPRCSLRDETLAARYHQRALQQFVGREPRSRVSHEALLIHS